MLKNTRKQAGSEQQESLYIYIYQWVALADRPGTSVSSKNDNRPWCMIQHDDTVIFYNSSTH